MVAANDTTLAATSSSGATIERSSSASTTKMTSRIVGTMTRRSRPLASCTSRFVAALPPTRASVLTASRSARSRLTVSSASVAVGGGLGRGLDQDGAVDDLGRHGRLARLRRHEPDVGAVDAGVLGDDGQRRLRVGLGHDDLHGRGRAGREVLADDPLGDDRVGVVEEGLVDGGPAGLEGRRERRRGEQHDEGDHPGAAGVAADEVGDPAPEALGAHDVLGVHVVELGRERPERLAAEEQQDRRAGRSATPAAHRRCRARRPGPSPEVLRSSASSRQSRPRMTVAAEATIGSTEPRQARLRATHELGWSCSSSLKRLTSSRA